MNDDPVNPQAGLPPASPSSAGSASAPPPRFPVVYVRVPNEDVDEVSGLLFELGATGVEERDSGTLITSEDPSASMLVASFSTLAEAQEAAESIPAAWPARAEELVGDAWRDGYKKYFVPFALSPRIIIRPPWQAYDGPVASGQVVLELEPGRAFGTGLHATTSLVARALDGRSSRLAGLRVLDVGTGSGILGLVALALGAASVWGTDVDPEAVNAAQENAQRNGVGDRFRVDTTELADIALRGQSFDVVCANIETRVLVALATSLCAVTAPSGFLVLSGILREQEETIQKAFAPLVLEERSEEGDWIALVFRRG